MKSYFLKRMQIFRDAPALLLKYDNFNCTKTSRKVKKQFMPLFMDNLKDPGFSKKKTNFTGLN